MALQRRKPGARFFRSQPLSPPTGMQVGQLYSLSAGGVTPDTGVCPTFRRAFKGPREPKMHATKPGNQSKENLHQGPRRPPEGGIMGPAANLARI